MSCCYSLMLLLSSLYFHFVLISLLLIIFSTSHTPPPQFNLPMMVAGFLGLVLTAAALAFSSDKIRQLFISDATQSNRSDRAQSNRSDRAQANTPTLTFTTRIRHFFKSAQSNLRVGAGFSVYYVATHGLVVFHILSTFSNSFIIEVGYIYISSCHFNPLIEHMAFEYTPF